MLAWILAIILCPSVTRQYCVKTSKRRFTNNAVITQEH